ncbi:hypothetical protein [Tardiphaga sp.]|uniref:hypothetical protein n=1 Tax=Tardiphaga sp. TaxID=1926292 RepID=UPI002614F1A1|nr:hypothetical protein [Tardiphaga sp.]MDB5618386.1 hypothetical protein [Tardiphaga sp.]
MANSFDQFDTPAAPPKGNAFDQFDAPAKPSVALDVAKAAPIGLAKGAISLPGLPGDLQSMGNALVDRIMLGAGHKVMDWTGLGPQAELSQLPVRREW